MKKKRVIIDVDPGIGVPLRDIDDALAIFLLLASPGIALEAVTVNFGNVPADKGFAVAREVLDTAGADIPLYMGAASRDELGRPSPAAMRMIEIVRKNPGKITLLAVAPLTNVATAMLMDKHFAPSLGGLVVMGGSLRLRPFCWTGEFNFHCDAKAAEIVLKAPVEKTIIMQDVCAQAVFTPAHLELLRGSDRTVARYCAGRIPSWLLVNRLFFRKGGFFPWDVVAAAHVINSGLFDRNPATFSVQTEGLRRGRVLDFRRQEPAAGKRTIDTMNVPLRLDGGRFMDMFLDGLMNL
jgi:purine nucleosidase